MKNVCKFTTLWFIPRRDSAKQIPKEVQLFLLMSYFVLGNVYWTFNLQTVFCLFETFKMFYPPKGLCIADTEGGPIVFAYVLFCVRKRILDFQFTFGFLSFWDPPECFIPRRDSEKQSPKVVQLFYLCFIPRRDYAKHSPMGSIWYSFHFIVFRQGCLMFQNPLT